ncbi:MAG: fimbrillin family protein [Proteiniphilum sp.]|uniref:fimbrillin family protein n=1 Tax=Proteiniphilum sp. TaxID=1926877 RepID=UPI002B1FFCBC|nr:fimbrillin family protein [Proteiniphilum sp.]MEA5128820.1 fimbrillin family protein [Proteiniphilum sp.]
MRSFNFFSLLTLGLLLLSACDSDKDYLVNPLGNSDQVKFQATIGAAASTRASGTSWDAGDAIGVYALNGGTTLPSGVYDGKENVKYTTPDDGANGTFTAATTSIYFPETGALDFVAYYPYQATINNYTYNINVADQSNPAAIDLLYSNNATGATKAEPTVSLQFKHKLSILVLNVAAGDGVASLDGLTASIKDLKTDGTFDLTDGTTIGLGTTSATITPAGAVSGTNGTVAAILVPGQDLNSSKITFSLAGQVYEWTPESMPLESGKKYTYSLQLSTAGLVLLQPGATIVDWEDADTGTGDIILTPEEGAEEDYLTVAGLRPMYTGSDVTITDDVKIKAVVVQNLAGGNSTSLKNIVVQDETAGIAIRFVDDNADFDFGDEVEISVKNQQLSAYNGLLQINNLPNENVTKIGTKPVVAKEITAAQLLTGDYESQYVAVSNVQVAADDLGKTFASASAHGSINMEAENGGTFVMFTSRYAAFVAETVPAGSGTLKGIASINNGVYQVLPTVAADYAGMTGDRFGNTLTVSPASIQFEATSGDTKTITVTASGAWTATTEGIGFSIDPIRGTGNATVTATANADTGVSGKITFTLDGTAVTKEVTVSQQTSGGTGTVIFSEDFNSIADGKGGNDGNWSGTAASGNALASFGSWSLTSGFKGYECIKMGAGSTQGIAQTPALTGLSGNAVLTFHAGAWSSTSEQTELLLEIEGGGSLDQSSVIMEKGTFNEFTVNITGGTAATKITFKGKQASNARFFLDDVVVTQQ